MVTVEKHAQNYKNYWKSRSDMLYYQYLDVIIRCIGSEAKSLLDIGTGKCDYLEWFWWIDRRVSMDLASPYQSDEVEGITGNFLEMDMTERFDVVTCLQVLEHVPDATQFARKVLEVADLAVFSVPYKWPKGSVPGHVHDPVTLEKLVEWVGRKPNYHILVEEPFRGSHGKRLFAVYDKDENRVFGRDIAEMGKKRQRDPS